MLNDEVPLIGFAGSPWTIMCYAVEGQGSKALIKQRILFSHPEAAHVLLKKSLIPLFYTQKRKSKSGSKCQILILGAECYLQLTIKNSHGNTSTKSLRHWLMMPGNCFRKGCWFALGEMGKSRASALDWTCSPRNARYLLVETLLYKEILIHQDCYRQFR
jgi:uroporphyrinogen decarboxylase